MNSARIKSYIMLILVAAIWGIASPVIKYTLRGFTPEVFLVYRFAISTLLALIIFKFSGFQISKDKNTILLVRIYGFLNSVVSLGFLFFGMKNTTVLEAGLITLTSPLITSTAGVLFLNEHITKREKIGMGIAILGATITIIGPLLTNGSGSIKFSGNLMIFGYVMSTLITTLIAKDLLKKKEDALTLTNTSFIIGFISFLIFVLSKNSVGNLINSIANAELTYHYGVWYMAGISGTLGFYLNTNAQKSIEIGEASLFSYLLPLFSLPIAVLWLGEKITPLYVIGGIIIIIGLVIAEIKKKRYN